MTVMNQNRIVPSALVFLTLIALLPLLAQALSPVRTQDCENKTSQFRCLLDDSKFPTATIKVTNKTSETVSFRYDEWHSRCGFAGGKVESNQYNNVAATKSETINAQNPGTDAIGLQITCREIYIADCKKGANPVPCSEVVKVEYTLWKGNKQ
jgi:hypothetical protein